MNRFNLREVRRSLLVLSDSSDERAINYLIDAAGPMADEIEHLRVEAKRLRSMLEQAADRLGDETLRPQRR